MNIRRMPAGDVFTKSGSSLLLLSAAATASWLIAAYANKSHDYWYLLWNLLLAWVPFVLGFVLVQLSNRYGLRRLRTIFVGLLWLAFLPNTFYILTDFIHLQEFTRVNVMLDIVMFTLFAATGLILGFASVYMVHQELSRQARLKRFLRFIIPAIFLLCAFALYLGREMRWNSWDIITDTFGIVFNISDLLIHPNAHPEAFQTTALFFVFLTVSYAIVLRAIGRQRK